VFLLSNRDAVERLVIAIGDFAEVDAEALRSKCVSWSKYIVWSLARAGDPYPHGGTVADCGPSSKRVTLWSASFSAAPAGPKNFT